MKPTLHIAEGDAELCQLYERFLTDRGYEVHTSTDGLDCLAKLRHQLPDVLLLDLELRWGGGEGVLAWLREGSRTAWVPVVLTATAGSPQLSEQVALPVVQRLRKPFPLTALLNCVRDATTALPRLPEQETRDIALPESLIGQEGVVP